MKILNDAYDKIPNSVIGLADFLANSLSVIITIGGGLLGLGKFVDHLISGKPIKDFP